MTRQIPSNFEYGRQDIKLKTAEVLCNMLIHWSRFFSPSAAWYKWTWAGLGKRSSTVHHFCQASIWGVLSASKSYSACIQTLLSSVCMAMSLSTDSWSNLSFLLALFRRRNMLMWSYQGELTTLVSICAFVARRFFKNIGGDIRESDTKCLRQ